jgi:hypothetical protein
MKALAVVLGIIFVILAILAATGIAHFAPALGLDGRHHTKHTVLYAVIAILCFIWARMSTEAAPSSR